MSINEVIVVVMAVFLVIGGIDRAIGNRFGLGQQFEEGLNTFGPLALSMVGMISLAPILSKVLNPIVVPLYELLGADPAMFAGTLLANDMGGYHLAVEMAQSEEAGLLAGAILAAMLGCTVVFTIPVGLGIISEENRPYFANGVLVGVVTIPFGVLVGGLVAGYPLPMILANLVPIVLAAVLIAIGLWKFPGAMTTGFLAFGKFLVAIISLALAVGAFEFLTGWQVMPVGWELAPVMEGLEIVAQICLFLMGAFPLMYLITKVAAKPLGAFGRMLGMNEVASGGLIVSMANAIPTFGLMSKMDKRGIFINTAWAVSAMAILGDHLGFTAGVAPEMITPMIVGKLAAAVSATVLAYVIATKRYPAHEAAAETRVARDTVDANIESGGSVTAPDARGKDA
ncbi:ethanolamine utilization protein EutH [Georgenia sp. 311]|uniref:ethanolamine utilization protein EutH n=1 Tax=Georgenia sp. 311 TaxID=2585134 RepID=UPI001111927F|nr:ethanolamine utilization protein EutH [Georgenia sp. 311]TNC20782.1 ethanolamine utilization protein EutH [Georgenia sp. 311]